MPIYVYQCQQCQHQFEALVFSGEQSQCPSCGSVELAKQPTGFATSKSMPDWSGPSACGTCGDPRGPGSCAMD
ncbi:MAG: zinc ribbon domain-containing protein [Acidobacteria bacterium]|nr:zinc ribbon domain-containing protein [Acidobacteriota bacterium]